MSLDFTKLVSQGRAKTFGVPWSPEELEALLLLESERGLPRIKAADYIRAGVLTLDDYDKTVEDGLVPETLGEVQARLIAPAILKEVEVLESPKEEEGLILGKAKKSKKK